MLNSVCYFDLYLLHSFQEKLVLWFYRSMVGRGGGGLFINSVSCTVKKYIPSVEGGEGEMAEEVTLG